MKRKRRTVVRKTVAVGPGRHSPWRPVLAGHMFDRGVRRENSGSFVFDRPGSLWVDVFLRGALWRP